MTKRTNVVLEHEASFDEDSPLIASFRNGPPAPENRKNLAMRMYENASKKRIVVSSTNKMVYQGANFGYLSASNDSANYAVGIYDKSTGKVRMCNVDHLYVMQQNVKDAKEQVDDSRGADQSRMEQRRALVDAFGSKKSRRMQASVEESVVNVDNVSSAASISQALQKKVDHAQEVLQQQKAKDAAYSAEAAALASTRNALLPPCDMDAPTPDQVYPLHKFINASVREALQYKAEEVQEHLSSTSTLEYATQSAWYKLPTQLLESLASYDEVETLGYVVYSQYLLQFFHTRMPLRKSANAFSEESGIPPVVVYHFLDLFSETTENASGYKTHTQPKALKDKLVLHLLVVALTVRGFSLPLSEIAADLKRSVQSVATYCRQLGCKLDKVAGEAGSGYGAPALAKKSSKQSQRAVLALPLQFPEPRRGGAGRR